MSTVVLDGVLVAAPRNTEAWLTANDPLIPAGGNYLNTDTGRTRTNKSLTVSKHWSELVDDQQGPKGDPGASAYEVAVQAGYTLSRDEWLNDSGPLGAKGAPGDPGTSFLFVKGHTLPSVYNANTLYGRW